MNANRSKLAPTLQSILQSLTPTFRVGGRLATVENTEVNNRGKELRIVFRFADSFRRYYYTFDSRLPISQNLAELEKFVEEEANLYTTP